MGGEDIVMTYVSSSRDAKGMIKICYGGELDSNCWGGSGDAAII